ncbi:unnamed protein product [marine sediment metagenome]|uniref:Uncharacterized protein n=1 Tax=marine sediment metagenome TaxID=412755 RepID=X1JI46_9ZZZZ
MATKAVARKRTNPGNPGNPSRRNRRRKRGFTVPLGIAVPIVSIGLNAYSFSRNHTFRHTMQELLLWFGVDQRRGTPALTTYYLRHGAYPLLGGILLHKVANKLDVNRALAKAGIPYIRI